MLHVVKRFAKVDKNESNSFAIILCCLPLVHTTQEEIFTGSTGTESILLNTEKFISAKKVQNLLANNLFQKLR